MADFLELEDASGLLELEDATGFLALEDGPPPPTPTYATWQVGTITIPSGTSSVAVTGLGGTPAAVFFWGTNWGTEDSAVTSTEKAIFRGMAAPKWDDPGTILEYALMTAPAGDYYFGATDRCGVVFEPGGDGYNLFFTSFDPDGFTVGTSELNSSGYKAVYAALMDVQEVGSYIGTATTNAHGWKAGAALVQGGLGGPGAPTFGNLDHSGGWYGSAAYPGTSGGGTWMGAGLSANTFPDSIDDSYIIGVYNDAPDTHITDAAGFTGPFLTPTNVTMIPTGGSLTDFAVNFGNSNGGVYVAWDDEDTATGLLTPPTSNGNTVTVSGLSFPPGLLIGYSISDEPQGQSSLAQRGAVGFSVVDSTGFQWAALIDGYSATYGAFLSFQRGFCDTVDGTDVHAGTIELTQDGFIMTTEEDSAAPSNWVWHAFGHPEQIVMWVPHIYRRVMGT